MSAARILGKQLKELLNGNHERIFAGMLSTHLNSRIPSEHSIGPAKEDNMLEWEVTLIGSVSPISGRALFRLTFFYRPEKTL